MIIENPDAFKSWLTSILEPLCDADPAALAKYVYALVKKDKPLAELRDGMLDQLDVFLQHETKPFVDMLFKSLETNEYLTPILGETSQDVEKPPSPQPEPEEKNEVAPPLVPNGRPLDGRLSPPPTRSPPSGAVPRPRVVLRNKPAPSTAAPAPTARPYIEQTLVKASQPLTELLEEPVDQPPRRRDRRGDSLREGPMDRRRRRSRSWERRAGPARRRPHREGDHERNMERRRPASRSPTERGRYRNRSPPANEREPTRSRSRSPAGVRERDRERLLRVREVDRDRASRDREHRERPLRDQERDRSRDRSREPSPHQDRLEHPDAHKRRCRDFDEKGYCMRGDLCQWDHGADPVVLEDAALSRVLLLSPPHPPPRPHLPVPEYNPLTPDIWSVSGMPPYPPPHVPHPPRELIPIPRVRHMAGGMSGAPAPPRAPAPPKNFDYNRLGPARPPLPPNLGNCSLEVKKVPRGLNDITHLNNHFSRFGKIVNIQVCFGNDPEGALITFSTPAEANVAYKSTEAVLNNRFIKVFWHNPELQNKQENQPSKPAERAANQHPLSHNKVLVNRVQPSQAVEAACAAAKELKQKQASEPTPAERPSESKKENVATNCASLSHSGTGKAVMEMHKRAQALLETQLQQQLLLIQKLESGNVSGPARAALLEAINSAQEGIEKLRAELVAYNKALRQATAQKKPKTREEAQKEILDAELDMFTKQQEGQDVTELAKKIAELRRQMALQYPHHALRRAHGRGGRFSTTRINRVAAPPPKVFNNQVVDHRPRALLVSGFEPEELDALLAHFAQYGEITGKEVNLAVPELIVQYSARAHAEQAAMRARNYNDRTLSITWVANNRPIGGGAATPAPAPAPAPAAAVQNGDKEDSKDMEMASVSADLLLEEEEEDEQEDRSWRR